MKIDGERLKALMKANKMTQQVLADKIGVERSEVSYWINGGRGAKARYIQRIAEVFSVFPESLTHGEHVAPDEEKAVAGLMAILQDSDVCPGGECGLCPYNNLPWCYKTLRKEVIEILNGKVGKSE